jgi:hypothetical protein
VAAILCAAPLGLLCAAPAALARWSAPARPTGCSTALPSSTPLIVFPSSTPQSRSGPGALLWTAPRGCAASATSATTPVGATLGGEDLPGPGGPLTAGFESGGLAGSTAAAGTAAGQIVLLGPAETGAGVFTEGGAVGAFGPARSLGGPAAPVAASDSYLGDVVLASPVRARTGGWALAVRTQRHYGDALGAPRLVPVGPGPPSAVAAAMDYRADTLLVWTGQGEVYARVIPARGALEPVRRLGSAGAEPEVWALLSDDGHAIVAWRSQESPALGPRARPPRARPSRARPPSTTIELSLLETGAGAASNPGVPLRIEHFRDLPGLVPPAGSLRLIRLSSEAVMMAWTGVEAAHYVVRASPVSLHRGAWAPVVISGAAGGGRDAVLADLVPGPDAEALALWSVSPRLPGGGRAGAEPQRRAILAARGHYAGHGEVAFEAPETVAPPGPNGPPAAALDPQSGQALAAWVTRTGVSAPPPAGRIAYALRAAGPASAPLPVPARLARAHAASAVSPLAAALAVLGLLVLLAAAASPRGAIRRAGHMRAHRG